MTDKRDSWDEYFASMARAVASRSTCLRLKVGAVLVQDHSVRGTGYNGAPSGILSCEELGECLLKHDRCIRSVHAEANLILQTDSKERVGATVYVTAMPCWNCALLLANSGISEVVYLDAYGKEISETERLFLEAGIILRQPLQKEAD
jgi:dCMP deaminase